jgi:hypothetical protein
MSALLSAKHNVPWRWLPFPTGDAAGVGPSAPIWSTADSGFDETHFLVYANFPDLRATVLEVIGADIIQKGRASPRAARAQIRLSS